MVWFIVTHIKTESTRNSVHQLFQVYKVVRKTGLLMLTISHRFSIGMRLVQKTPLLLFFNIYWGYNIIFKSELLKRNFQGLKLVKVGITKIVVLIIVLIDRYIITCIYTIEMWYNLVANMLKNIELRVTVCSLVPNKTFNIEWVLRKLLPMILLEEKYKKKCPIFYANETQIWSKYSSVIFLRKIHKYFCFMCDIKYSPLLWCYIPAFELMQNEAPYKAMLPVRIRLHCTNVKFKALSKFHWGLLQLKIIFL